MSEYSAIQIIVGLGNPGDRYDQTRHNAGFWFVDELARRYGGDFREDRRHQGEIARIAINDHDVRLLKPSTFMNRSGNSARSLASYLKVPVEGLLVAHDELDLPVGTARLKRGGGPGGHNGLKDLIAHVGKDFLRLRLGIGHPEHQGDVVDFVLSRPSRKEGEKIRMAVDEAAEVLPLLLGEGEQKAMKGLHTNTAIDKDKAAE